MSFYEKQVLPRLIHLMTQGKEIRKFRGRVLSQAYGTVLEIGFGSGLSLPFYTNNVKRLLAVEPSETARTLASKAIAKVSFPVEFAGLDGQKLDLADASVDCAVSFLTLCTIPDAAQALKEVRRVLKPGGKFIFFEHGASPDPGVLRWQNRLNGLQGRVFGGCNLNRRIADLIAEAKFEPTGLERQYVLGMPRPMGYAYFGSADRA